MQKIKDFLKKNKGRLTGISTPIIGAQWEVTASDYDVARKLIIFLEDRRVLYVPCEAEVPRYAYESIQEIRKFLTEQMMSLNEKSLLMPHYEAMRAECRRGITELDKHGKWILEGGGLGGAIYLNSELGRLRGVFGIHLALICSKLDVELSENLKMLLPANTENDELEGADE
jgi:hypothetical protein